MLYLLSELEHLFSPLRVFEFITPRAGGACLTAFILSLIFGNPIINRLILLKAGQPIRGRDIVHKLFELHETKVGTPTMGGILILGTIFVSTILWSRWWNNPFLMALIGVLIALGALGFADDYKKVKHKKSDGVSARVKLTVQFGSAIGAGAFLFFHPETRDFIQPLNLPFLKGAIEFSPWLAPIIMLTFFVAVIVGSSNAVNLTDGLDGLATGCLIVACMTYAIFAYVSGHQQFASYLLLPFHPKVGEVTVFCMAMVGAGLGFLWFNAHPARVFMGDTGSLSQGGLLGVIAICCRQEILLAVVGGVFVMEAVSVILQVGSFKMRGKRIFRMAPIHHHFELAGWKETKVITRFWIVAVMCALAALATLKIR